MLDIRPPDADDSSMRLRILTLGTALTILVGLLTSTPASAAILVDSISLPGGQSEFYSPFGGPAAIKFTFTGAENDAIYNVRIRPSGGNAIHDQDFLVDADDPDGFQIKSFDWPAISRNSPKTYVVAVYRGGNQVASESFTLLPPLVKVTSASPNPFLPWIDDDIKDEATITYRLLADSQPVIVRVYEANASGRCCGAKVRESDEHNVGEGTRTWVWDGRADGGALQPKGDYFVKITATDPTDVTKTSRPFKVSIARTYRASATTSKPAMQYHHRSAATPLVSGGDCYVTAQADNLRIICQGAKITVYWRWGLDDSQRIERASFVYDSDGVGVICPPSIRRIGHSRHESSFTMVEDLSNSGGLCRLVTAKITYSYPVAS